MYKNIVFLLLLGVASITASSVEHPVDQDTEFHLLKEKDSLLQEMKKELAELKSHVHELRELTDRTRIQQKLSALAFYQDFVVNAQLKDWSWMCKEFLTEDVHMTVYTSSATFQYLDGQYRSMSSFDFRGCQNVTKFYNATVSTLFAFIYHPYVNPWIEVFEDGTANSLVSGMNNAVIRKEHGPEPFWSFNYYTFGWKKTSEGWKINRFIHLSSFTVPYQGTEAWSHIPVPFTALYDLIINEYPVLGQHFKDQLLPIVNSSQPIPSQ